jgi:topoisomerase IA-like protein
MTHKRYSFSLPLELASRLEALCEMHPQKARNQLLGDLLSLGLAEVERARTTSNPELTGVHPDTGQPIYLLTGPFAEFRGLTHRHHLALERKLAKDDPEPLPPMDEYTMGNIE